ncbi:MAG: hypothetical protein H6550_14975 [Chitinophagales bacterium]|nr:hypothetical protein [Chitinophagales bacterium]
MTNILFSRYRNCNLDELAERLGKDYYEMLAIVCTNVAALANELEEDTAHPSTVLYTGMAVKLVEQVEHLVGDRQKNLMPYLLELDAKKKEGHNCLNCSGRCHVGHAERLMNLRASHDSIKRLLTQLDMEAMPLHRDIEYPKAYKILRNEMKEIDNMLNEVFYIEELYLVPKVFEAQKAINA